MHPLSLEQDLLKSRYRRRPSRIMSALAPGNRSGSSCGFSAPLSYDLFSRKEERLFSSAALGTQRLTHSFTLKIAKKTKSVTL